MPVIFPDIRELSARDRFEMDCVHAIRRHVFWQRHTLRIAFQPITPRDLGSQ